MAPSGQLSAPASGFEWANLFQDSGEERQRMQQVLPGCEACSAAAESISRAAHSAAVREVIKRKIL